MSDRSEEIEEIVVTGTRIQSSEFVSSASFSSFFGGGGTTIVVDIERIDPEDLTIDIELANPNEGLLRFDFSGLIVEFTPADYSTEQLGSIFRFFTEFSNNPRLQVAIENLMAGGNELVINFAPPGEGIVYTNLGNLRENHNFLDADGNVQTGFIAENLDPATGFARPDTVVYLNINSDHIANYTPGVDGIAENALEEFQRVLVHEFTHLAFSNTLADEEATVSGLEDAFHAEFFRVGGAENGDLLNVTQFALADLSSGSSADNNFVGSTGNDNLFGNAGNDTLSGGLGSDVIDGGIGNDRITGGAGSDFINGGAGNDLIIFNASTDIGTDLVVDESGTDRLTISNVSYSDLVFEDFDNSLVIRNTAGTLEIIVAGFLSVFPSQQTNIETFQFGNELFGANFIRDLVYPSQDDCLFGCEPDGEFVFPVVLDLDGDGIELVSAAESRIRLDANGDGIPDRLGFVGPDDGLLALDRNGNGRIDGVDEISFIDDLIGAESDLEGLLAFDSNADGILDANDERFTDFLIFQDRNGNGRAEQNELLTLIEAGIESIDLGRVSTGETIGGAIDNVILNTSFFTRTDGTTGEVGDVAFFFEANMALTNGHDFGSDEFGSFELTQENTPGDNETGGLPGQWQLLGNPQFNNLFITGDDVMSLI